MLTAQFFPQSCNITLNASFSCWGVTDFLVPILSETLTTPALIRSLKSLISFKVTLDIALVTSSVSCFSQNAFVDRNDGIASFLGVFSNSFCHFVISLALSLTPAPSTQPLASASCELLKQYIILCHNLLVCSVKFACFTFNTVDIELLNLPIQTFYLNFEWFTCFQNTRNLVCQVLFGQLKQPIVLPVLMRSFSILNIWSFLCLRIT